MRKELHIQKNNETPIYIQIDYWIQEQILSGEWPPQYKLKSEEDLAIELCVSRGTVHKSIKYLV